MSFNSYAPNDSWCDRALRLSGECSKVAYYVRTGNGGTGTRLTPAVRRGFKLPKTPRYKKPRRPTRPKRNRAPRPAPKPAAQPRPTQIPKVKLPNPLGGLSKLGRFMLRRLPLFKLGALLLDFELTKNSQIPWKAADSYNWSGWTKVCQVGPDARGNGNPPKIRWEPSHTGLGCSATCTAPNWNLNYGDAIPLNALTVWEGPQCLQYAPARHNRTIKRIRPAPGAITPFVPGKVIIDDPAPALPWPGVDPLAQPPGFQPTPRPIPWAVIPHRQYHPGRDVREQPGGSQPGRDKPEGSAPPTHPPGTGVPAPETEYPPKPHRPPWSPGIHRRRPPHPRKEKERKKLYLKEGAGPAIAWALGAITEAADMVGIAWDSLPPEIRRQYNWNGGILDRAAFILQNVEHIRPGHLVANWIANQLEDKAFGRLGKLSKEANQNLHDKLGIDLQGRLPKAYNRPRVDTGGDPVLDAWNNLIEQHL